MYLQVSDSTSRLLLEVDDEARAEKYFSSPTMRSVVLNLSYQQSHKCFFLFACAFALAPTKYFDVRCSRGWRRSA
jgi:hypothetical protein